MSFTASPPLLVLVLALGTPKLASAEGLPPVGPSRALSPGRSIARDAPVGELAYGPRGRAQLGAELGLYEHPGPTTFRLGSEAFLGVEEVASSAPGSVGRGGFEVTAAFARAPRWLPAPGVLELTAGLGRRSAFRVNAFEPPGPYRPEDVPFGGGGWFLGLDAALRQHPGAGVELESRLGLSLYTNAFVDAVGQHAAASVVADSLREGAAYVLDGELVVRLPRPRRAIPTLGVAFDALRPHDDSASPRVLVRTLLGATLAGRGAELLPFIDAEIGHGQGLLVNRTEARLGTGVRFHVR